MATKKCLLCKEDKTLINYIGVRSPLLNGTMPICRRCIANQIAEKDEDQRWNVVNKLCQLADIPFIPSEFERIYKANGRDAFGVYCQIFRDKQYETLDWQSYNKAYLELQEDSSVEDSIPELREKRRKDLIKKWGANYDEQSLVYLENLYNGIVETSGVVGALNNDQILKLCKVSLTIEEKLRAGMDIDKDIKTLDTLSKLAGVTTQATRSSNELTSMGEICAYLEKLGFKPNYWHGAVNDEVDKSMKAIMYWARYLYINEDGIADEINERINNLKIADKLTGENFDWGEYQEFADNVSEDEDFSIDI